MRKPYLITLILGSFALGFFASEYRHAAQRPADNLADSQAKSLSNTRAVVTDNMPVSTAVNSQDVSPPRTDSPGFSWDRVNQLIANSRFAEAISQLEHYLAENNQSAYAWFLLAQIYEKQDNHDAALNAWFRYLDYEVDALKIDQAIALVRDYLMRLYGKPSLFAENSSWLIEQLNELLQLNSNDAELHVMLASLYAKLEDNYQAQYHAMMAANDPAVQKRAEDILAELDGSAMPDEMAVPLIRYGNQYLVSVTIEGYAARLLLDTGASLSGVSNTFTARYPFIVKSTKPIRLNTASGTVDSYLFTVDTLRINELAFNQHILALLPMHNMTEFDGLLGVDILGRFDFVIDQDALLLRLRTRNK